MKKDRSYNAYELLKKGEITAEQVFEQHPGPWHKQASHLVKDDKNVSISAEWIRGLSTCTMLMMRNHASKQNTLKRLKAEVAKLEKRLAKSAKDLKTTKAELDEIKRQPPDLDAPMCPNEAMFM